MTLLFIAELLLFVLYIAFFSDMILLKCVLSFLINKRYNQTLTNLHILYAAIMKEKKCIDRDLLIN